MMNPKRLFVLLLACCALPALIGCKQEGPGLSDIQATGSGGRHIHVLVEGNVVMSQGEDNFTVKLRGHELVIGKEQVLVDGKERAKIPTDAKRFEVISKGGTLTVSADRTEVLKTPLEK